MTRARMAVKGDIYAKERLQDSRDSTGRRGSGKSKQTKLQEGKSPRWNPEEKSGSSKLAPSKEKKQPENSPRSKVFSRQRHPPDQRVRVDASYFDELEAQKERNKAALRNKSVPNAPIYREDNQRPKPGPKRNNSSFTWVDMDRDSKKSSRDLPRDPASRVPALNFGSTKMISQIPKESPRVEVKSKTGTNYATTVMYELDEDPRNQKRKPPARQPIQKLPPKPAKQPQPPQPPQPPPPPARNTVPPRSQPPPAKTGNDVRFSRHPVPVIYEEPDWVHQQAARKNAKPVNVKANPQPPQPNQSKTVEAPRRDGRLTTNNSAGAGRRQNPATATTSLQTQSTTRQNVSQPSSIGNNRIGRTPPEAVVRKTGGKQLPVKDTKEVPLEQHQSRRAQTLEARLSSVKTIQRQDMEQEGKNCRPPPLQKPSSKPGPPEIKKPLERVNKQSSLSPPKQSRSVPPDNRRPERPNEKPYNPVSADNRRFDRVNQKPPNQSRSVPPDSRNQSKGEPLNQKALNIKQAKQTSPPQQPRTSKSTDKAAMGSPRDSERPPSYRSKFHQQYKRFPMLDSRTATEKRRGIFASSVTSTAMARGIHSSLIEIT